MPAVPAPEFPTVTPDVRTPDDYQHIQTDPSMFGGAIAQGVEKFGQGVQRGGEIFGQVQTDDALNNAMSAANARLEKFKSLSGQDALNDRIPAQQDIDATFQDARAGLTTLQQQYQFDQTARTFHERFVWPQIANHADQQGRVYTSAVNDATTKTSFNQIASNADNDNVFLNSLAEARNAAVKETQNRYGMSVDPAVVQSAVDQITAAALKTRIEAWALKDPMKAAAYADLNQDGLGEQAIVVNRALKPYVNQGRLDGFFGGTAAGQIQSGMPVTGTGLPAAIPLQAASLQPVIQAAYQAYPNLPKGIIEGVIEHESTWQPNVDSFKGKDAGAGLMQIGKEARQQYGVSDPYDPAQSIQAGAHYLSDMISKYGDPRLALAAYDMGPGAADKWIQNGSKWDGLPKETQKYIAEVAPKIASPNAPDPAAQPGQAPDWNAWKAKIDETFPIGDPLHRAALSRLNEMKGEFDANTADLKWKLLNDPVESIPQKIQSALEGGYVGDIPENDVRAVFPKPQADKFIEDFHVAQAVGQTLKGMRWDSPEQFDQDLADLSSGNGVLSETIQSHAKSAASGPGTVGASPEGDAAFLKYRTFALQKAKELASQRWKDLYSPAEADPAQFALSHPAVQQAFGNVKWNQPNPETGEIPGFSGYAAQQLAKQNYLGVPISGQHLLTRGQAEGLTNSLMQHLDDPKNAIVNMSKQYGSYWPQVFGDMVQLGKLPGNYEALENLDATSGSLLARALNETKPKADGSTPKTWDTLLQDGPGGLSATKIREAVESNQAVKDLANSWQASGSPATQVAERINGIVTLAYAQKFYNNAPDPVGAAVQAYTKDYSFDLPGNPRVPAKNFQAVQDNAQDFLSNLKPESITMPPPYGLPYQPKPQEYIADIQANPRWVTSPKDDGLWLKDRNGGIVKDQSGKPAMVPFNAPRSQHTAPSPGLEGLTP